MEAATILMRAMDYLRMRRSHGEELYERELLDAGRSTKQFALQLHYLRWSGQCQIEAENYDAAVAELKRSGIMFVCSTVNEVK